MSDIANAKTAASDAAVSSVFKNETVSVRVAPKSYYTAALLGAFFTALFVYLEIDSAAIVLFTLSLVVVPALAMTDRLTFDGKRLRRTGFLPRLWAWANGFSYRLKLSDVEQIETQAMRTLKRGGNVFYLYRTSINGKGLRFDFSSRGEEYRRMIRNIFPRVSEYVLDNRSIELRDYLNEPKEVLMKAEFARIPSSDVLEDSVATFQKSMRRNNEVTVGDPEKADYLRRLANELRLSGYLLQALEAFRRALIINPRDARLLFEAARCLNSYAGTERDEKLFHRSRAMLRLAEKRAAGDNELLARVGESFFQFGDWEHARKVFVKSIERTKENFRALRGMAEISLREGKIAHVIHNFSAANRLAETPALRRWTQTEADYFSHLNNDEEYMEMEISRINLLETLENSKRHAMKISMLGFPAILIGLVLSETLISNIGWAISSVALAAWTGLLLSLNLFSERIPYELIEEEEE